MDKIIGFAPDVDPSSPGVLLDCSNLIPDGQGMRPAPSATNVGIDALPDAVRGALAAIKTDGGRVSVVATTTRLYTASGTGWADISGTGAPFTLGMDERWALKQFGDSTLASCISVGMRISNGGAFAAIASAPKAKILVALKGFVMAFNTSDTTYGVAPDRWWCSAYLNASDWTPNVSTQCTTGRLVESGGEITAAERLGDNVVVYKGRSTFIGRYTGPAEVWNFTQVDSDVGCVGMRAVCDTGKVHYFIGLDDIYAFDGVQVSPIGRGVVRDWYVGHRDPRQMHKSIAFWDAQNQLAWFFFPGSVGNGDVDTCLVFHPATGRWGRSDQHVQEIVRYSTPAATYDGGTPLISTFNAGPSISFDSPFWTASQELMSGFDASNRLIVFSGEAGNSSFTTGDYGDEDQLTWCHRLSLRLKRSPDSATATGYTKDDGGGEVVQASTAIRDDGAFDLRQRGRWHRFKVDAVGEYLLIGVRPIIKQAGYR